MVGLLNMWRIYRGAATIYGNQPHILAFIGDNTLLTPIGKSGILTLIGENPMFDNLKCGDWCAMLALVAVILVLAYGVMYGFILLAVHSVL